MAVVIRPARPHELGPVGALTVRAFLGADETAETARRSGYEAVLADAADRARSCEILVAVDGDALLGAVTYVPGPGPYAEFDDPTAAGIRMLAVEPGAQGRGVGTALSRACLDRAEAAGRSRVILHTVVEHAAARAMYARLGFRRAPELDWTTDTGVELLGQQWTSADLVAAAGGAPAEHLDVVEVEPGDARVTTLVDALIGELVARYGGEGADPFRPTAPGFAGRVLLALRDGHPVGTVTMAPRDHDVEVKRMFVDPAARGSGVGRRLLMELERRARADGAARIVLETGTRQPEAVALYRGAGYRPIPPYGYFRHEPDSRCFAKGLREGVRGGTGVGA